MKTLDLALETGDALSVLRFESREAAGAPFSVTVLVRSPDPSVDIDAIVGGSASLHVADEQTTRARGWRGIVARMEQVGAEPRGLSTYELVIVPEIWLLGKRTNHRIFQHLGVRKIVSEILGEWRIDSTWDADDGQHPPFEYRVQYGESDLAFVSRLLEESGITLLFPESPDAKDGHVGARVHLSDRPGHADPRPVPLRWIEQPGPLREEPDVAFAVRWAREVRPGAQFVRDHDFMRPTYALGAASAASAGVEARLEQHHYRPGAFLVESDKGIGHDEDYGERVAERGGVADRAGHRVLSCEATTMELGPGVVFGLSGHPHPDLGDERRFLVTELACAGGEAGEPWVTKVRAVPAELPYHPPRTTPRPRIHGVQSATVVGPGEIHTDASGRVRVHFPWDRAGKTEDTSCWIRPAQGWSGSGYGAFALPRVGQEVLVSFLEGDPDQPVIVGRLHNQTSLVPYTLPDRKTESGYRSASSPGGGGKNEIILEDASSKELFSHHAERDQRVLVKNDDTSTIGNDRLLRVAENHRDETLGDRVQHTVGSRFEHTALSFTESTARNARRQVGGDDDHYLEGSRLAYADKDLDAITEKVRREEVRSHEDITVKRGSSAKVGGESIGASSLQVSAGKIAIHADGDMHVMGGTIVIEGMSVTAKSGGSFVNCNPGGVAISGPIVKINEGGAPGSLGDVAPAKAELPTAPPPASPLAEAPVKFEIVLVGATVDRPVVGERVELEVKVVVGATRQDAAGADVTWTVQGDPVASYTYNIDRGEVIWLKANALKETKIDFCWPYEGDFTVKVRGSWQGSQPREASRTFSVCRPKLGPDCGAAGDTVDVRADPFNRTAIYLRYGQVTMSPRTPGNSDKPGIEFTYSAAAPPRTIGGEIAGLQLIKMMARQKVRGGNWQYVLVPKGGSGPGFDMDWVLDNTAPYAYPSPLPATTKGFAYWRDANRVNISDSPCVECRDGDEKADFSVHAKMFYMYKPNTPGSIWVTLGCIDWFAKGSAVQTQVKPPTWVRGPVDARAGKIDDQTRQLPEWISNMADHKWVSQ